MIVQLDETFLDELGLSNATDDQKREFIDKALETLQMRVGARLAENLTDEQMDEFEHLTPQETDAPEVVEQKQQQMTEWLQRNNPNQDEIVTEEFNKLKNELKSSLGAVFNQNAS
jgi:hypothetical protein